MKNASPAPWGRSVHTLAQKATTFKPKIVRLPGLVNGQGADISNVKQMHRWAEEKLINESLILALIDIAKSKGAEERRKRYWRTWRCLRSVITHEGRLYAEYCKNKACAICCGIRKASLINHYTPTIKSWEKPFTLVLTLTNTTAENLRRTIDEMFALLRKIIDKYLARERRGKGFRMIGIRTFECTYNPKKNTYHPHFHFILANKKTAIALQDEWMREGRELWGRKAISQAAQDCKPVIGNNIDKAIFDAIKYSTKIITEPDPLQKKKIKKGDGKIYVDAFDNIIAAMERRRIFERFGFNLPKQPKKKKNTRKLNNFKEWVYLPGFSDWQEVEGALTLTNYIAPLHLHNSLKEIIVLPNAGQICKHGVKV